MARNAHDEKIHGEEMILQTISLNLVFVALGVCLSEQTAAAPAFPPKDVEQIREGEAPLSETVRLRVSVVIPQGATQSVEAPRALIVCSENSCYRSLVGPVGPVGAAGRGVRLIEIAIPPSKIWSIHFEGRLVGEITLSSPFEIPEGFYGGELYVALEKKSDTFAPAQAAGGLFSDHSTTVYYDPRFDLNEAFSYGVRLSLAPGATKKPQVFSVAVKDTGEDYPMVDIFPPITLASSGRLTMSKLDRSEGSSAKGVPRAKPLAEGRAAPPSSVTDSPTGERTIELSRTGAFATSGRLTSGAR